MQDGHLTRMEFDGIVEHRHGQQFVGGRGLAGDTFARVHRIEPHGFASYPVKGGIGAVMSVRGNRDSAYAFGGENPALRPGLPQGATALYDAHGNIIKLFAGGAVLDFGARTATLTAGNWTINGNVTINGTLHVTGNITSASPDGEPE